MQSVGCIFISCDFLGICCCCSILLFIWQVALTSFILNNVTIHLQFFNLIYTPILLKKGMSMDTLIQLTLPTMDTLRDCLIHI